MRQQRAKRYRKAMALYHTTFQFREPYQVLLSADFILAAHRFKLNLPSLLQRTLQAPLKLSTPSVFHMLTPLVITQCSISELYSNGEAEPIALAKTCERRRCGHIPDPLSSHDCLTDCINISGENKHRYILATQDERLRMEMRLIPGVPMVYIRRAVMIMEPPSPASTDRRDTIELDKLGGRETLKRKRGEEEGKVRKKKGPKEPNPLSIKKKKKSVKENARKDGEDTNDGDVKDLVITESNIIGDVTDSVRRSKSTRRRRHHKPNPQQTDATTREDVVKA